MKEELFETIWQLIQIQSNGLVYALSYRHRVQNLTTDNKLVITDKRRLHFVVLTSDYILNKCYIFPFYPLLSTGDILSLDGPFNFVFVFAVKKSKWFVWTSDGHRSNVLSQSKESLVADITRWCMIVTWLLSVRHVACNVHYLDLLHEHHTLVMYSTIRVNLLICHVTKWMRVAFFS